MRALILAAVSPDNTPHGYNWTFVFPMVLFAVSALVLWALFGRPHHRVPARPISLGPTSAQAAAPVTAPEAEAETGTNGKPPAGGPEASQ